MEKFVDDKTNTMLLKELRKCNMGEKEKAKHFDQKLNYILNKFPSGMQPHDLIDIDYYITSFPTNISSFIKRVVKETLALNFAKSIVVEK